eukprot:gene12707-20713_t
MLETDIELVLDQLLSNLNTHCKWNKIHGCDVSEVVVGLLQKYPAAISRVS